jgi:hypothetical protein
MISGKKTVPKSLTQKNTFFNCISPEVGGTGAVGKGIKLTAGIQRAPRCLLAQLLLFTLIQLYGAAIVYSKRVNIRCYP